MDVFSHFAEGWSRCRLDDNQLRARERDRLHEAVHEFGHLDPLQGKQEPDGISLAAAKPWIKRKNLLRYKVAIASPRPARTEVFKAILYNIV